MTDNIGLYVMGFMLGFAAICWVASVVCAWFCEPKQEPEAPYKLEPQANYLADCEWPVYSENPSKNHHNKEI